MARPSIKKRKCPSPPPLNLADAPDLFNEQLLSRITGRSVSSIQKDRLRGTGVPFVVWGRLVRYRKETVIRYLEAHERHSTSEGVVNLDSRPAA